MIYLDNAATTLQKPPAVIRASADAMRQLATPGRGGHSAAMKAAETAFACREEAAKLFSLSDPERVVFTLNATHALNIAIRSLVKPGDTVLISGYEHNAVTRPLHMLEGVQIKVAKAPLFDARGMVDAFRREMTQDVSVVISTHVSNVFGFVLPVEEIARLCREREKAFILDASQSAGCLPVSMEELQADFIVMPGHKGLYGPQGTGMLLCGTDECVPVLYGGTGSASKSQEMPDFLPDRLEAGTHNMPGIAGLLQGLRFVRANGLSRIQQHESQLIKTLTKQLRAMPGTEVFSAEDAAVQTAVLSFRCREWDCEELADVLGRRGIAVRAGLHCAPLAHESAGTLDTGTVRVSVSAFTTRADIQGFLHEMHRILRQK